MDPERDEPPRVRELHLEGLGLSIAIVLILTLSAGAFWLGRAYERAVAPAPGPAAADPLANLSRDAQEASDDSTFFDTLSGGGKSAEPQREARTPASQAPPSRASAPAQDGPFLVQVFAGRDRRAAEDLVASLRGKGYPVRVEGEREGRGTLFRVRVGGYGTRGEADAAAERLVKDGYAGAWVTRRD